MEDFIKTSEAAKMLGVAQNTVQQWCWKKKCPFPVYHIGPRLTRFRRSDVENYLKSCKQI